MPGLWRSVRIARSTNRRPSQTSFDTNQPSLALSRELRLDQACGLVSSEHAAARFGVIRNGPRRAHINRGPQFFYSSPLEKTAPHQRNPRRTFAQYRSFVADPAGTFCARLGKIGENGSSIRITGFSNLWG